MTGQAEAEPQATPAAKAAIFLLGLAGIGLTLFYSLPHHWTPYEVRDYSTYWLAGRMVLDGTDPYDSAALGTAFRALSGSNLQPYFSYPPHALLLFAPLGALPLGISFWTYQAIGFGLFIVAARPHLRAGFPLVALLSPASLISFSFGQSGMLVGALWLLAFSGSATALAALTMRPQLGLLAGVEGFRSGIMIRATFIFAIVAGVTTALLGLGVWQSWLDQLLVHSKFLNSNVIFYRQSPVPVVGYGIAGWLLFGAAALFFLSRAFNVFTAATATFLIAPHGLHYDMAVVSFGCVVLLFNSWERSHLLQRAALALGFLSPALVYFGTWFAPPILLVALHAQVQLTRTSQDSEAPAHRKGNSGSRFSFTRWKQARPNKESNSH